MNSDFKEILKSFLDSQVEFLVVGGFAVMRYTEPRYTKDLDILINNSPENSERVIHALKAFGAPLIDITAADFMTDDGLIRSESRPVDAGALAKMPKE
jgi:hypothetical protein